MKEFSTHLIQHVQTVKAIELVCDALFPENLMIEYIYDVEYLGYVKVGYIYSLSSGLDFINGISHAQSVSVIYTVCLMHGHLYSSI